MQSASRYPIALPSSPSRPIRADPSKTPSNFPSRRLPLLSLSLSPYLLPTLGVSLPLCMPSHTVGPSCRLPAFATLSFLSRNKPFPSSSLKSQLLQLSAHPSPSALPPPPLLALLLPRSASNPPILGDEPRHLERVPSVRWRQPSPTSKEGQSFRSPTRRQR